MSLVGEFLRDGRDKNELFHACVEKLWFQGRGAYEDGGCVYRTSDGAMCAVGILLDEAQLDVLDGKGLNNACNASDAVSELYDGALDSEKVEFLDDLQQQVHDLAADLAEHGLDFRSALVAAACAFSLRHFGHPFTKWVLWK